jgi:hypothetical protein
MTTKTARHPDFRVKAMDKATNEKSQGIGAAWLNVDNSVTMRLDPFVILHGGQDLVVTLFPIVYDQEQRRPGKPRQRSRKVDY